MKHALLGAEDVGEIGERAGEGARGAVGLRQTGVGVDGLPWPCHERNENEPTVCSERQPELAVPR